MLAMQVDSSTLPAHQTSYVLANPEPDPVSVGAPQQGAIAMVSIEERIQRDIVSRFGLLSFPELKLAIRQLSEMLMDRLANKESAAKAREEMEAFDLEHPELVIFH